MEWSAVACGSRGSGANGSGLLRCISSAEVTLPYIQTPVCAVCGARATWCGHERKGYASHIQPPVYLSSPALPLLLPPDALALSIFVTLITPGYLALQGLDPG